MGLDVALGILILIAAIRGWIQGFTHQFIRLGGLIASFYLAAPVRDEVKPHIREYIAAIPAEWVDRILWWLAVSVTDIVIVGFCTLFVKMTRRPEVPGIPAQRSRNDQFAGFLLGLTKGALVSAFLVAGLVRYGLEQVESIPWAKEQVKTSQAIAWNDQYRPAVRIWRSGPVQHLAGQIYQNGLKGPAPSGEDQPAEPALPIAQTARKPDADLRLDRGNSAKQTVIAEPPPK